MTLTIHSNGSKWYGEEPDSVEVLLDVLGKYPLDPSFEDYGNFVYQDKGTWWVFGNFLDRSHVFRISADNHAEVAELEAAIRDQATPAYQAAREEWQQRKKAREEAFNRPHGEHTARLTESPGKKPNQGRLF